MSEEQTRNFAHHLGARAQGGDVFALIGELGAGKTVFAQGIAAGFGVPSHYPITSPTFAIINEYESDRGLLFHLDIYRLAKSSDLTDIGADEILGAKRGIAVVEWADKAAAALPEETIFVRFFMLNEDARLLEITAPMEIFMRLNLDRLT